MITIDSAVAFGNGTNNLNHATWSHTIGNFANRVLIIFIPVSQATFPSTITYGGVALTGATGVANGNSKSYIYYMFNPPVGTANCVITYNATLQYLVGSSASFYNCSTLANATTAIGTASNKTFTQACTKPDSIILECYGADTGVNSAGSGQTMVGSDNRFGAYDTGIVAGNNSQTWNCATSGNYAWSGIELQASETYNYLKPRGRSRIDLSGISLG